MQKRRSDTAVPEIAAIANFKMIVRRVLLTVCSVCSQTPGWFFAKVPITRSGPCQPQCRDTRKLISHMVCLFCCGRAGAACRAANLEILEQQMRKNFAGQ